MELVVLSHEYISPKYTIQGLKLNLGCGKQIKQGFDNIDIIKHKGIIKIDLFKEQLSNYYKKNSIDYVFSSHFFEHIPHNVKNDFTFFDSFVKEILYITKENAILDIVVPFPKLKMLIYPDHIRLIDSLTFSHFILNNSLLLLKREIIRKPNYHLKKYFKINFGKKHSIRLLFRVMPKWRE